MQVDIDRDFFELIGGSFKEQDKTGATQEGPSDGEFFKNNERLLAELIKARVKILTEATDICYFIEHRFAANSSALIIVAGDFNNGPRKERIERRFFITTLLGHCRVMYSLHEGF